MADQAAGLLSPWLRSRRMAVVKPYLRGRVLDFGCGVGRLATLVAKNRYTGFDTDPESIQQANRLHPGYIFQSLLPKNETFNTVVALAVLEHLEEPAAVLRNLGTMLAPGGTIALTTPHAAFEWMHTAGAMIGLFSRHASEDHEELFDEQALRALGKNAGFSLAHYHRFLGGVNQLAVFKKIDGASDR